MIERVIRLRRLGPYQIQAAIAACHAEAPSWEETDWRQILILYEALLTLWPTEVVRLNRAIAMQHVVGAAPALQEVDALAEALHEYHLFHATRAQLLRALERAGEAQEAEARALQLATNPAERALIEGRLLETIQ